MSYEVCVYQPATAADRATAYDIWNDEKLWELSLPVHDRSAPKWRIKALLMAFDKQLQWMEPEAPKTGLFAKWFGKPAPVQRHLHVYRDYGYGRSTFDVFDQGIEITLPWEPPREEAEKLVRALWHCLQHLSVSGWSTILDTEREVLIDLDTDMETVIARYLENLVSSGDDAESTATTTASASPNVSRREKPFTGNVD